LKSLLRLESPCACGKTHKCATETMLIQKNITPVMSDYIKQNFDNAKGCIICDFNTEKIARDYGMRYDHETVILDIKSHHADEFMIEDCEEKLKGKNYDYFIACGSGTIHDITRMTAFKRNAPFISYPTAPSVDGFVSDTAPITTKTGMKITRYAAAPVALFADIDVLASAPKRLVAAGAGDILGKYTALADWRISNLLTGEYICGPTVKIQYNAVNKAKDSLIEYGKNKSGESYEIFCGNLLEALVISGLCMQYTGNSRPASGCEHHVSHFFEMGVILSTDCLHGENVGVGSVLCADLYHKFAESKDIKFVEKDLDDDLVKKYYQNIYDEIIKENAPNSLKKITPEIFYKSLNEVKKIISDIPSKEELAALLDIVGGVKDLAGMKAYDLKCDENEIATLALKLAPYIRDRVTLLKLMRCVEIESKIKKERDHG